MTSPEEPEPWSSYQGRLIHRQAAAKDEDCPLSLDPVDWWALVPKLVHPTKVIILEAMCWIGRPMSASELEKIASGKPALNSFSYHLDRLLKIGVLKVVGKVKARKASSAKKETFFSVIGRDQWIFEIKLLNDSSDPLIKFAQSRNRDSLG